ncbi:hypothetical protein DHEL01_v202658 [Diaporthe helianthi]|uniref:MARVEL domain-containing protein n=1 Tax=Diaporthe helianthi TaxID=158607 RepID=A0A2P5I8W4_DIAHE|nr:hypothetical protein DHEL01_v202658 [Diaporthe helianthi]
MALGYISIAHIVAGVFSIIELGLTAYVVSLYDGRWDNGYSYYGSNSPDRVNFMVFNSVWSLLVLVYIGLTPLYITSIFHRLAALVLEALTMIFWFAGSIALAVFIGVPRCLGNTFCGTIQAAVAFGFFLWAVFLFLVVLDGMEAMKSRRHSSGIGHKSHKKPFTGA